MNSHMKRPMGTSQSSATYTTLDAAVVRQSVVARANINHLLSFFDYNAEFSRAQPLRIVYIDLVER